MEGDERILSASKAQTKPKFPLCLEKWKRFVKTALVASFDRQIFGALMRPLEFPKGPGVKPLLQRMAEEKRFQMERGSIGGSYFVVQLPDGSMEKRLKMPINIDPGVHSSFNLDQLVPGTPINALPTVPTLPTITEAKVRRGGAQRLAARGGEGRHSDADDSMTLTDRWSDALLVNYTASAASATLPPRQILAYLPRRTERPGIGFRQDQGSCTGPARIRRLRTCRFWNAPPGGALSACWNPGLVRHRPLGSLRVRVARPLAPAGARPRLRCGLKPAAGTLARTPASSGRRDAAALPRTAARSRSPQAP